MKHVQILIIEDSPMDTELVVRQLRLAGLSFDHLQVEDEASMRTALERTRWDAVLSDFNVPGFGALQALNLLKQHQPDVPFIVVSGAIGEEAAVELMKAGADDFLMKSNLHRLGRAVLRALRESKTRLEAEEAKRQAFEAVRAREEMLAVVSHDMKNPLGAIKLNTQLIQRMLSTPNLSERERRIQLQISRIQRSVERMNHLICDVLDLAKLEAGKLVVEKTPSSVDDLIAEVMEQFDPIALQKSIVLESDLPEESLVVEFDRERLFQVLSNLVGNAVKFSAKRTSVVLSARNEPGRVVVSVRDTGPGIPEADRRQIFERYWQADHASRYGTGLGLSIAKGIIEAHGGEIWVESVVGQGSCFSFSIPKTTADLSSVPRDALAPRGRSVLLIDDDEDLNQLFSKALSDQGFRVRSAMNAEDGLKLLRTAGHHSLIVVDSRLPEMTGAEFIRKKRGLDGPVAQVPVLLTSADRDLPMLARELGLSRYFQKPGNLTDFLRIVEESICGAA